MTRYRIQSLANVFGGLTIMIQARFQPSRYATPFSSKMLLGGGVLLLISGVALFFAPESRAGHATTPPNER
jgi:uncharacterized membrane protein YjjP (DUF1212 family)